MKIEVDEAHAGARLDQLVVEAIEGMGRAGAKRLFAEGRVRVVGREGRRRVARKGERAALGMQLEIDVAVPDVAAAADPDQPLAVVYENADFVVVDKPAGVASAPLRPGERGTIANALVARYPAMREVGYSPREPGICHRLDIGTSGLMVAAKSSEAFTALTRALLEGTVDKAYLAIVSIGALPDEGLCDRPLVADPADARRVTLAVDGAEGARAARTSYRVLRRAGSRALVEVCAARAFRHQVRVHMAALGAPLLGDALYGGEGLPGLARHALHASLLAWEGAEGLEAFRVESPLPEDLEALLA